MSAAEVGSTAPDFSLPSQKGVETSLSDLIRDNYVVLYFYPKDYTPGCTVETRAFAEDYEKFRQLGAEIIGISSDDLASHKKFAEELCVEFPLLSDTMGKVRSLYGAKSLFGIIPSRTTFIIDKSRKIRKIIKSQSNPKKHVKESLTALETIVKESSGNSSSSQTDV
jgi:peroxiredoxin Q/BCP